MGRGRRILAAAAAMLMAIGALTPNAAVALEDPAPGDITAVATLSKTASVEEAQPGQTFTYTITVGCSSITDAGCRAAVTTDTIPAPFVLVDAVVGAGANDAADPVISGNNLSVTWTTDLGDGTQGILDATTAVISVTAMLPADTSYDHSGIPVVNNAVMEGTNFADAEAQVAVAPIIPLDLATTPTKSFDPTSLIATPGAPVTAHLGAANQANATVESLVIQDPVDPLAAPNPFTYAGFTGFGAVTPPTGATGTAYEVFVVAPSTPTGWVPAANGSLPGGVAAADVRGTRVTFTGDIPAGAAASVDLALELTALAAAQPDGTNVANTVQSQVSRDGESATGTASADLDLRQNAVTVSATKSFDPSLVVAGESSTVTVGGANASAIPIEDLRLTEPSSGSFPAAYTFAGITHPVEYPNGATTGEIVYRFADATTETVSFADGAVPPAPSRPVAEVASFEAHFTGTIVVGGETSISFAVDTDPVLAGLPVTVPNEVGATGSNLGESGTATAADDLYIYGEQIETYIGKRIRPGQILAVPGEVVTVSLTGGLTERPDPPAQPAGTTGNAAQIVIQDPIGDSPGALEGADWWNAFDLTGIAQTPVLAGSTLTIEYYDTTDDTWKTLVADIAGPQIYSDPSIPAGITAVAGGIRFVYEDTTGDGFPPGTDLAPNFTSALRSEGRYVPGPPFSAFGSTFVPNCAQSGASSVTPLVPDAASAMQPADCPEIELIPTDPGNADLIDKAFGTSSSGGVKSVIARSGDTIPSTLSWSTGGYSGFTHVDVTDVASPATTPIASSIYNAFNLARVGAITPATDPLIAYDQVQRVELYNGTTWVDAANDPCPTACIGTFPGVTLTAGEQASTIGVRLVFVESPDRAETAAGDLDAPTVGSGVTRSFGNDRPITLVWQVRDTRRSDGSAVLGDETYNLPDEGVVRNIASATGYPATGAPISASDQDDVTIIDVPLTTTTSKTWTGGPLAVPTDTTLPPTQYPLSTVSVTTRNTTPARVDQLVIREPAPGSVTGDRDGVFNAFLFVSFTAIAVPAGATSTQVILQCPDGTSQSYSRTAALALTAADLPCDVSGVLVSFDGRIASNAAGTAAFNVRLRPYWRGSTTDRVDVADSPVSNTAQGVVADVDPAGTCPPPSGVRYACDQDVATIILQAPTFGVTASKTISPAQQKEGITAPVTVTIGGTPSGSARTATMILEDADAAFWNAFDFVGMPSNWTLTAPLGRVQACYLSGADFSAVNVAAGTVGGTWTCQPITETGGTAPAAAFLAAAAGQVQGVRFQVWQANGLGWTNPVAPHVQIPFQVQRRTDLRSGGPVPTTRDDQVPAPGQDAAGEFADTSTADSESVSVGAGTTLTARDDATAEYRYLHLTVGISVTKSPSGDVRPGIPVPFTLTFRNSGELPLQDPVFRDRLPTDGQGAQLILDPDRDPSVPPWRFALSGAAPTPPHGLALPTDPAQIDVQQAGDVITFTPPAGSVLEPGQTYTITILLMLRPGLTPADSVRNWAAIAVDVPVDQCSPVYDAATGECRDDAVVRPLAVPALSTIKYVKADNAIPAAQIPPVRSVMNGFSCAGTTDPEGFYRAPCVPVTVPGETETWKFRVTNSGTLPMDQVVSIDNLPTPDDQGLIVTLPRDSAWEPTWVGGISLQNAPAGATLTTYYSTSSTPCIADLNPLGTPCSTGAWQLLDGAVPPASVASLKFVVTMDPGALFQPGQAYTIRFQTRTTPSTIVATPFPTAWNTVATGGTAVSAGTRLAVPATEGRKVGVSYPTGPVELQKTVTGPAAGLAPGTFPVQLTCTSAGTSLTGLPRIALVPGATPTGVTGLPYGATCTAMEGQWGQTGTAIGTTTVGFTTDPIGFVSVVNDYQVADLTIRKSVLTAAVDQLGRPIEYGPFPFSVTCTFLGNEVWADGYDASRPMAALVAPDGAWALAGLPVGAECTVTEDDALGATGTSMVVVTGGISAPPVDGRSAVAIIDEVDGVEVTAVNAFGDGSLTLSKVVDGPGADDFGAGPFTFVVECTLETGDGVASVWLGRVTLGRGQSTTIDRIATGAACQVTETDDAGATRTVIAPGVVTIGDGTTVAVTATNTFDAGSITVTKVRTGEGAGLWGARPFEVSLECTTTEGAPVTVPGGGVRTLDAANGYATTYEPLLVGVLCELTETDAGGATSSAITGADGEPLGIVRITAGDDIAATVTNTFDVGALVVTKTLSGDQAVAHRADTFEVTLACTLDGRNIVVPGGASRAFGVGAPAQYDDLPIGAQCAVTETRDGGAQAVTMSPADGRDRTSAVVTIGAGAAASIIVDNRFDSGLAATGRDALAWIVAGGVAAMLAAAGVLLLVSGRRRRQV